MVERVQLQSDFDQLWKCILLVKYSNENQPIPIRIITHFPSNGESESKRVKSEQITEQIITIRRERERDEEEEEEWIAHMHCH